VHRDIKKSNILLHRRTDGNVGIYFLDFGSSIQLKKKLTDLILDSNDLNVLENFPKVSDKLEREFFRDYVDLRQALVEKGLEVNMMALDDKCLHSFAERDLATLKSECCRSLL
jgi:serine/threonine protein kinase